MKKRSFSLMIILCAFVLSACAAPGTADLEGKTWVLDSYNGVAPIEGAEPNLEIVDGQAGGRTGCNQYGGGVEIDGESIRFEALFQTEMACMEPEGLMEQERAYLELLGLSERYEVSGDTLTITTSRGDTLVFTTGG